MMTPPFSICASCALSANLLAFEELLACAVAALFAVSSFGDGEEPPLLLSLPLPLACT